MRTRNRSSWASGSANVPSSSIGFWVASTRKGAGMGRVCPSTETCRSCIASSSADCVRGVARLISSTRRTLVKIGPGMKRKLPSARMLLPVTSLGSRSGVPWTRPKPSPSDRANARARSVLPTPGTSSSSAWPSARSAIAMSRSGASAPTTACATAPWSAVQRRAPACGSVKGSSCSCATEDTACVSRFVDADGTLSFRRMPPTPLIASDDHLAHDGLVELVGGVPVRCYESPERAIAIREALVATGDSILEAPGEHGPDPIAAVHDLELIDLVEHVWVDAVAAGHDPTRSLLPDVFLLREYAGGMPLEHLPSARHDRLGAHCFDTATPILAGPADAARASVDIALTALDRVLAGAPLAYGLCRPPGHHAARNLIGGYCFYNNAAIVAESVLARGAQRVAILDVDFHHGNGTQQIFWERGDVLYVSLHGDPRGIYPYYSGYATERGAGDGLGTTLNVPLAPDTDGDAYLAALADGLDAIRDFDPDAPLVLSLGFDTYHADPICNLALRTDDYGRIGSAIGSLGLPVVALQEGGYAVDALGANV